MNIRVELLGSLRLFVDGTETQINRSQVRRALALLAANRSRPVTQDQLVEHLWASRLPADPRASLRVALSRLRDVLQPYDHVLQPTNGGYMIEVDTDVDEFERRIAAAGETDDHVQQAVLLEQALDCWRSTKPVEDLDESPLLEPFCNRLVQAHALAVRRYIGVLASLGSYDKAAATALPLLSESPGDEQLAMASAQSLAALGRKAKALEILNATREHLRSSLGLNPTPELLALEDRILRDGVQIAGIAPRAAVDSAAPTFVGRGGELRVLSQGDVGLHVIVGEPGAGKTALLNQAVDALAGAGRVVLRSAASATPPRPMEVLSALLVGIADAASAHGQPPGLQPALARLAPERVSDDVVPPDSRDSLLGFARQAIEAFALDKRAVIVIDDAQWLDRSSAQVISELADANRITVLASTRQSVPAHVRFMHDASAQNVRLLPLLPLTQADIGSFVAVQLPLLPQQATVSRLLDQSGGNPLFLSLLTQLLAEGALEADNLPSNVLISVQSRIDTMSRRAQKTLQLASVFSGDFVVDLLCDLQPSARADLDEAIAEGLVQKAEEVDGMATCRFSHALVADAAYQLLSEGTRLELHDEVGRVLEDWGAPAAEFALHCGEAASVDPTRAVQSHRAAATEFATSFAWDTAMTHAERALRYEQEFGVNDATARAELLVLIGRARRALGNPTGDTELLDGVRLAVQHGMTDLLVTGLVTLTTHGRMGTEMGEEIYDTLETTLADEALTRPQRARLLASGSTLVAVSPLQGRGRAMFREAFDSLADLNDANATRDVLMRIHLGCPHFDDFERRQRGTDLLAELAHDDPDILWEVAYLRFGSAMIKGHADTAAIRLEEMRALTPRTRLRRREFGMKFSDASWARFNGELADAEAHLDELMAIGAELFEDEWTYVTWAALTTSIREAQGRLHELLPLMNDWIETEPSRPTWRVLAAAGAASEGDAERARRELDWLMRDDFACLPTDVSWAAMFSFLTGPVALLQDRRAAAALLAVLEPYSGLNLWNGVCIHQSVDAVCAIYRDIATLPVNQTES